MQHPAQAGLAVAGRPEHEQAAVRRDGQPGHEGVFVTQDQPRQGVGDVFARNMPGMRASCQAIIALYDSSETGAAQRSRRSAGAARLARGRGW